MDNKSAAVEFEKLLETSDRLLAPDGCPWDREQTLVSMRDSVLEEACEVIEAIDEGSDVDLMEELGDLLYNMVFFCKLAEKENRFKIVDPIKMIREKLISRHPHVFGEVKLENSDAVIQQWEAIKKKEKSHRESLMDGIPKGLPALARGYKVAGKIEKVQPRKPHEDPLVFESEEELGELLWEIVLQSRHKKLNPEMALRKHILQEEMAFRKKEKEL